jgi:HSP20 family protein
MPDIAVKQDTAPATKLGGVRHPLLSLREEVYRLVDDFFHGFSMQPLGRDPWPRLQGTLSMAYPAVDVAESEEEYRITAELPGMTERDVEVTLAGGMLTVKGEKEEKEERKQGYTMAERRYGSFRRTFSLSDDADAKRIEASLKDGVLTVVLPHRAEDKAQARKVEIRAAA